jgi:hypothetical protein
VGQDADRAGAQWDESSRAVDTSVDETHQEIGRRRLRDRILAASLIQFSTVERFLSCKNLRAVIRFPA